MEAEGGFATFVEFARAICFKIDIEALLTFAGRTFSGGGGGTRFGGRRDVGDDGSSPTSDALSTTFWRVAQLESLKLLFFGRGEG